MNPTKRLADVRADRDHLEKAILALERIARLRTEHRWWSALTGNAPPPQRTVRNRDSRAPVPPRKSAVTLACESLPHTPQNTQE